MSAAVDTQQEAPLVHFGWCDQTRCQSFPGGDVTHISAEHVLEDVECTVASDLTHLEISGDEPADWVSLDVYDGPRRGENDWPTSVLLTVSGARRLYEQLGAHLARVDGEATR